MKAVAPPKESLIEVLRDNLSRPQPERSHKEVHASDLTKDVFCPREFALLDLLNKNRPAQKPSAAQAATWHMGNVTSDAVREHWLGGRAFGDWECIRCNQVQGICPKPTMLGCLGGSHHLWKYREVKFRSATYDFTGSIDVLSALKAPDNKLTITELKIIDKDEFAKLAGPYAEHRIRTALYMKLVEDSDHPYREMIDVKHAKVLYVMRGFGKKHETYNEILPFKEFDVERDDDALVSALGRAATMRDWRKKGLFPPTITGSAVYCPHSKGCSVAKECLGGKFAGVVPLPSATPLINSPLDEETP
jgi:hypothetical protein